jgi:hypothetical protein
MTAALAFIASCLIGAFIIEVRARYRMRRLMEFRVAALDLDHAEHSAEQATNNNRKQNKFHRGSPVQYQ